MLLIINCEPKPAIEVYYGESKKPSWINSPQPDTLHFYGVGIAEYTKNDQITRDLSIQKAVNQISLQISTMITSSLTDSVWQEEGWIGESFEQVVKMSTKNFIKDWEIVDHWNNTSNGAISTLARLNKKKYYKQVLDQNERFKNIAYRNLQTLDMQFAQKHYNNILSEIVSGLYHTRLLFGEKALTEYPRYSGISIDIAETIKERANKFFDKIILIIKEQPPELVGGINSSQKIVVEAIFLNGNRQYPLPNLPLLFNFESKEIPSQSIHTDVKGRAVYYFGKAPSFIQYANVKIGIDLNDISFEQGDKEFPAEIDYNRLLPSLKVTATIPVRRLKFYMLARERIKGYDVPEYQRFVSTAIKEALTDSLNASFVPYQTEADFIINTTVNAVYSSVIERNGERLFIYRATAKIDLMKPDRSEMLYSFHLKELPREAGLSESLAAENALRKTAIIAKKEIVEQLLEYLKKGER